MRKYSKTIYLPEEWNSLLVNKTIEILVELFSEDKVQSVVLKTYSAKYGEDKMTEDLGNVNTFVEGLKPKPMGRPKHII